MDAKFCTKCGSVYYNFCVECRRRELPEKLEVLMDKFGLTDDTLIQKLAGLILEGEINFSALKLAIGMKGLAAPTKVEAVIENKENDASRLADIITKLSAKCGETRKA